MQTFILPVAFLFLAALLLWMLIDAQGKWWLKLVLMIVTLGISAAIGQAVNSYFGYPRAAKVANIPKKAFLYWANIQEPDKPANNPGGIYLWMRPESTLVKGILDYSPKDGDPIAYKLPYSRTLHQKIEMLLNQLLEGKGTPLNIAISMTDGGKKDLGNGGDGEGVSDVGGTLEMYVLPPALPPSKIAPSPSAPRQ